MARFLSAKISLVKALAFSLVFFGGGFEEEEPSLVRLGCGGMMRGEWQRYLFMKHHTKTNQS